ncbi:hypothetical protein KSP40_PGU014614 [Platanthera guangdongensis]|uniref:FRIGIDA-like protein n=1 Tax=Platanthera guangdongensis TaxID=2320717 RepID=A0ABR2MEZ0_9ASPA
MLLADIAAVMNSIPAKKEELQKAFEELQSCSSSSGSFTFQWKDIDEHISSIQKSIAQRFQQLKALDKQLEPDISAVPLPPVTAKKDQYKPSVVPPQNLKSLCINMDAKALRSYIISTRKDHLAIRRDLAPAILFASDPVALVLDLFEGFANIEQTAGGEAHAIRRSCFTLLGSLHQTALDIKPLQKERARRLAMECKELVSPRQVENDVIVLLLLQLIGTFGLVEFFQLDGVVDLLVMVAARQTTVELCMNSILREKVPDLIEKLNSMGRQIESIKFVIAFNLIAKYPPDRLLHAYVKESRWWAADRGGLNQHNFPNFKGQREAIKREIFALKKAIKTVEEYHLHHAYHPHSLREEIRELKKLLAENWQASSSTRKMRRQLERTRKKQLQSWNSYDTIATVQPESRNLPQLGFGVPPSFYKLGGEAWTAA